MKPPYRGSRPPGGGGNQSGGPRPPSRGPAEGRSGYRADNAGHDRSAHDRPAAGNRPIQERPRGERAPDPARTRSAPDRGQPRAPDGPPRPNRLVAPKSATREQHPPHRPEGSRTPDAPKGTVWLYGLHAVAGALANPARRLRRLMLSEEAEKALAALLPPPWSIQPERTDRARIDHLLGRDAVHQGAALLADPLAPPALAQVLERQGPVLVLDQVIDPRNVGAILRSAAAFGIAAVITQERNAPEETGALAKAASGALEKIPLLRAVNIARTLLALKAAGCWVVGLAADGKPLHGPALAERRVALVLGSEGEGLRRLTRDTCDEIAGIGMPKGHASEMESLNVSAATAVALYELGRRA